MARRAVPLERYGCHGPDMARRVLSWMSELRQTPTGKKRWFRLPGHGFWLHLERLPRGGVCITDAAGRLIVRSVAHDPLVPEVWWSIYGHEERANLRAQPAPNRLAL